MLARQRQARLWNRPNSNFPPDRPPKAAPNAKPSAAGLRWRGGARKRAQFSPLGGNGDKRTLRRRRAQWDGGRVLDPPLRLKRSALITRAVPLIRHGFAAPPSPKGEGRGMGLPKPSPLGEGVTRSVTDEVSGQRPPAAGLGPAPMQRHTPFRALRRGGSKTRPPSH